MKNNIVRLGVILCIISALAGGVLAFTNKITKDKIEEVELAASMSPEVLEAVMPGCDTFADYDDSSLVDTIKAENEKFLDLKVAVDASGNQMGYAIKTLSTVSGYGGDIELFIGISPEGDIKGLYVTALQETKGLGSRVTESEFQSQFIGKSTDSQLQVVKNNSPGDDEVQAVTGATISSRAFTSAINNAFNIYNQYLKK